MSYSHPYDDNEPYDGSDEVLNSGVGAQHIPPANPYGTGRYQQQQSAAQQQQHEMAAQQFQQPVVYEHHQQQQQQQQYQQQQQQQQQQAQLQQQQQQHRGGNEEYELGESSNFAFFGEVDDIKRNLVQYEDNVERIEGLHKRSLAETNIENEEHTQRQLDQMVAETRGLAQQLKERIKKLEAQSARDATKRTQAENLKRQFMTLIQRFQASEASFRQRYRSVAERQYRIVDPGATDAEVQQAIDDTSGQQIFSQALLQSNKRGEARAALSEVQARHREIQKIEQTMAELAQLFSDMEVMVAEQDEQVQAIDENTYKAQHDVEMGVGAQHSAILSARAWRKKKWWCIGILLFIAIVLALVLGLYFGLHDN